jgi:hypothetical protein
VAKALALVNLFGVHAVRLLNRAWHGLGQKR